MVHYVKEKVFLPAYHMNKEHWVSIVVDDENVSDSEILDLVTSSYNTVNKII